MEKYYRFANVEIVISIPECWMYEEDKILAPFRVEHLTNAERAHHFSCTVVEYLSEPEGKVCASFPDYLVYMLGEQRIRYIGTVTNGWENAYIRAQHRGQEHWIEVKKSTYTAKIGVKTILRALEVEHLLMESSAIILHSSYVSYKNHAILFTAPSGTGKSTQAELWGKYRNADIINGDRSAVLLKNDNILAAGIPFAGSSTYCENEILPLEAIVYLEQAPKTKIEKIQGARAFRSIWEGCTINNWDGNSLNKAIAMVKQVVENVPIYHLACTPDESAVLALEQMLISNFPTDDITKEMSQEEQFGKEVQRT